MTVFLDTNVLVSAFATRGLAADVFRLVLTRHAFVTGEVVLEEVERVLAGKIGLPAAEVEAVIRFLREYPCRPKPEQESPWPVRDPDDALVLATALEAGADVLVTGDRDLLEIAPSVTGLRIVSPREFWNLHRG